MATFAAIKARWRRLVAEAFPGGFFGPDDTIPAEHVNTAYTILQKHVREVAAGEFLKAATANVVADQFLYERPTYEHVVRYDLMDVSITPTAYRELTMVAQEDTIPAWRDGADFMSDGQKRRDKAVYIFGKFIVLVPTPTVSITRGLKVSYVDVVQLTAEGDVPRLPEALHHLLAYGGAIFALEESKDAAEEIVDRYRRRWEALCPPGGSTAESRRALGQFYHRSQSRVIQGRSLA